jgi:syntaxin-binding protein 1
MVSDLLPLEDGLKYRYDFQAAHGQVEKKDAVLSESDGVWTDVRHLHMRDAINRLMGDFNGFLKEHGGFSARCAPSLWSARRPIILTLPFRLLEPAPSHSTT